MMVIYGQEGLKPRCVFMFRKEAEMSPTDASNAGG